MSEYDHGMGFEGGGGGGGGFVGGGGAMAHSNGTTESVTFSGFLNKNIGKSFEQTEQKFDPAALGTINKFFKAMQGMAQTMSIASLSIGQQVTPGNLIGISSTNKVASLFGGKG